MAASNIDQSHCHETDCKISKFSEKAKLKRIVTCRAPFCSKYFHCGCIGLDRKSDKELHDMYFLCDSCIKCISCAIPALNEYTVFTTNLVIDALTKCVQTSNDMVRKLDQTIRNNLHGIRLERRTSDSSAQLEEPTATATRNDNEETRASDADTQTDNVHTSQEANASNQRGNGADVFNVRRYLCGIEAQLSLSDITLILEDSDISLDDVVITEPQGDFRRKRFLIIKFTTHAASTIFQTRFNNSKLYGFWFLAQSPPKPPNRVSSAVNSQPTTAGTQRTDLPKQSSFHRRDYYSRRGCNAAPDRTHRRDSHISLHRQADPGAHNRRNDAPVHFQSRDSHCAFDVGTAPYTQSRPTTEPTTNKYPVGYHGQRNAHGSNRSTLADHDHYSSKHHEHVCGFFRGDSGDKSPERNYNVNANSDSANRNNSDYSPFMFYANTRSAVNKLDSLRVTVASLAVLFICITETWYTDELTDDVASICNYVCVRDDRSDRRGGGAVIYYRQHLNCALFVPADRVSAIEDVWIICHDLRMVLLCIYIPPDIMKSHKDSIDVIF